MKRRQFLENLAGASWLLSELSGPSLALNNTSRDKLRLLDQEEMVLLALDPQDFPSLNGAQQVLEPGQKHPENPVLRPRPGEWDGTRCKVYGTVLYDSQDRLFKMWYSGTQDTPDAVRRRDGARRHVGYAYSHDGVHWERPALGIVASNGTKANNLIHLNAQAPSVFLFEEEPDPNRRFLMITETGLDTHQNKLLYSADGIHWTESAKQPMNSRSGNRTHEPFSILYDPKESEPSRRWKGYSLLHVRQNGYRGRAVGLFLAASPESWVEYPTQPILSALDGMESEIHIPHVTRFHDTYIMLYDAMEPNHHTQTEVAVSSDGIHFRRVQNGVKLLPNGKPGEPDAGKVCVSPRALFVHEGKIWWYYTISPDTYQTGPRGLRATPWHCYTALAQWRQEGFASLQLDAGAAQAEVTSRFFKVSPKKLVEVWLNGIAPAQGGGIRGELIDRNGHVLAVSKPWIGDELRGKLQWLKPLSVLASGQEVALRLSFKSVASRIYAASIRNAERLNQNEASIIISKRSPTDRRVHWTFQAKAKISASPVVDEDSVYFGSWDQHVYALDKHTGKLRWQFETGNAVTTVPAIDEKVLYVGSRDGYLYALEAADGRLKWKVPASTGKITASTNGAWVDCSPTIGTYTCGPTLESPPPKRLFLGCHNRDLHAFDLSNGEEQWRFPTFNWILSQPVVDNYIVYFGSIDGSIYALDARCGALVWSYRVGKYLNYAPSIVSGSIACEAVCGAPLVANETLYCGADDGFLYALDARTGKERWAFQTEKWVWGRPMLHEGVLIVASAASRIYGLDAESGKKLWQLATGNANYASVVAARNLALIACTNGCLYGVNPATGEAAWTFVAEAGLRAAPVVDAEKIYLPTCGGTVHALAI